MREIGQDAADEREEGSCIEYHDSAKDVAELSEEGICRGEGQQIGRKPSSSALNSVATTVCVMSADISLKLANTRS